MRLFFIFFVLFSVVFWELARKSLANWKCKQRKSSRQSVNSFVSGKCLKEASLPAELRRKPDIKSEVNATFMAEKEKL